MRELKNVAEQLSVISEERSITAEELARTMPQLLNRNLPVPSQGNGFSAAHGGDYQERELLYKVLFDMKKDLNDLKSMFYELVKSNDLRLPDMGALRQLQPAFQPANYPDNEPLDGRESYYQPIGNERVTPIIIEPGRASGGVYDQGDVEDSPLAMDEIEKEAIKRALTKYKGRRKEAAEELKISERTLYRKIKQYGL